MYALLTNRRLRWLGHVTRMHDGRLPKDILYGELATESRPTGGPTLLYKDMLKRDLKAGGIAPAGFEALAADRSRWRYTTESAIKIAEQKREEQWEEKRARRRQRAETDTAPLDDNAFTCSNCDRVCRSRIGLYSHSRRCSSTTDWQLQAQTPLSPETDGCQLWIFLKRFSIKYQNKSAITLVSVLLRFEIAGWVV